MFWNRREMRTYIFKWHLQETVASFMCGINQGREDASMFYVSCGSSISEWYSGFCALLSAHLTLRDWQHVSRMAHNLLKSLKDGYWCLGRRGAARRGVGGHSTRHIWRALDWPDADSRAPDVRLLRHWQLPIGRRLLCVATTTSCITSAPSKASDDGKAQ